MELPNISYYVELDIWKKRENVLEKELSFI